MHRLAGEWERSNLQHNVNLRKCLVEPPQLMTFLGASDEKLVKAWLVLHEDPKHQLGYAVVYDEGSGDFGLAQFARGYEPCLIGILWRLLQTLEAM